MTVNVRHKMSYLTQVTITNHNREVENQVIEVARAEAFAACEETVLANARA